MSSTAPTREELGSLKTKLFYGFGSVAYGVKDAGFGTLLLFYYNQVIGLPVTMVGTALFIILFVDAFADPIVGQVSDNFRSRLGRRHPFMYAAAIPVAIAYYFLWVPPHWSHQALFVYLIVIAIIVRTFITMYEIPSSALVPEMSADYDQRTSFLSFRYFFGVMGGVFVTFTTLFFILRPDALHKVGQLNPAGYPIYAAFAAVVMVISILVSTRGTQRFVPLFRQPTERRPSLGQIFKEMSASLSHGPFVILVLAAVFGTIAIGLGGALLIYFNTYFWGLSARQLSYFSFAGVFSAIIAPLIAGPLGKRFGKNRAVLIFYGIFIVVASTPISLRLLGFFPPNGSPYLVPLLFLERSISAVLGISTLILFASMMADVVDDAAIKTGRRSEGLFFAAMGFIAKALSGAGNFFATWLLFFVGFPEHANPATINPEIVRHLAMVYLPALVVLYGTGITILSRYKITRSQHEANLRQLAEVAGADAPAVGAAAADQQVEFIASQAASSGPAQ
jgi:Na+/melibiose symporter-like transporter